MDESTIRAVRRGVESARSRLGTVVLDLSVWEGRGDWGTLPMESRRASGEEALTSLNDVIRELAEQRAALTDALATGTGADTDTEA